MEGRDIVVRKATPEDYSGVMQIESGVYDGRDYLPYMYHVIIQNKNCFPYVLLVDGQIAGFMNMVVMDNGRRCLSMSGRVTEKYRGHKLADRVAEMALREVSQKFHQMELVSWTQVNHPRDRKYLQMQDVKLTWRLYTFDVDKEKLKLFALDEPSVPVNSVRRLSLAQSNRVFSDADSRTRLFPEEYFVVWYTWAPFKVSQTSLVSVAKTTDVTASLSADGSCVESVCFTSLIRLPSGIRMDLWIYGSQVTPSGVLAYVHYWLKKSSNQLLDAEKSSSQLLDRDLNQILLLVHFPIHVDKMAVRGHLESKLGAALATSTFDSDEAICCVRQVAPPANL